MPRSQSLSDSNYSGSGSSTKSISSFDATTRSLRSSSFSRSLSTTSRSNGTSPSDNTSRLDGTNPCKDTESRSGSSRRSCGSTRHGRMSRKSSVQGKSGRRNSSSMREVGEMLKRPEPSRVERPEPSRDSSRGKLQLDRNDLCDSTRNPGLTWGEHASMPWKLNMFRVRLDKKLKSGQFGMIWSGAMLTPIEVNATIYEVPLVRERECDWGPALFALKSSEFTDLLGICFAADYYLVCFAAHGLRTLEEELSEQSNRGQPISLALRLVWARKLVKAVYFLQDGHIVHGNITTEHCLVDGGQIKLSLISAILPKKYPGGTASREKFVRLAPELWTGGQLTMSSDTWALATLLDTLFGNGRSLFDEISNTTLRKMMQARVFSPVLPPETPAIYRAWMVQALRVDPSGRPPVVRLWAAIENSCPELPTTPDNGETLVDPEARSTLDTKFEQLSRLANSRKIAEQNKKCVYVKMTRDLQRATKRNPREVERILTGLIDGTMTVPVAEKEVRNISWDLVRLLYKMKFTDDEVSQIQAETRKLGNEAEVVRHILRLPINQNRKMTRESFLKKLRLQMAKKD